LITSSNKKEDLKMIEQITIIKTLEERFDAALKKQDYDRFLVADEIVSDHLQDVATYVRSISSALMRGAKIGLGDIMGGPEIYESTWAKMSELEDKVLELLSAFNNDSIKNDAKMQQKYKINNDFFGDKIG